MLKPLTQGTVAISAIVYSPIPIFFIAELGFEHTQQALGLSGVAFERVWMIALVACIFEKVPELAKHWANVPDLKEKPLQAFETQSRIARQ